MSEQTLIGKRIVELEKEVDDICWTMSCETCLSPSYIVAQAKKINKLTTTITELKTYISEQE